jgi:hypothetical protein
MTFRKLQIVWSVAWGIACEVSLVAWIGSYFKDFWMVWGSHRYFFFDGVVAYGRMGRTAVPIWVLAVITAAVAAAPWLTWRFSLRTLMVATMLIASLLGVIVWMQAP